MVRYINDRVGVMYLVEVATSEELYENPFHSYTQALLSAMPIPNPHLERTRERIEIKGSLSCPIDPPIVCVFRTRCPFAQDVCENVQPFCQEYKKDHWVACHKYDDRYKDELK